jgi:hypothetical protein
MIANMLWKLYPLNPVPWVRPFVVMILKYLMKGKSASKSTRICGGKTPLPPGTLLNLWKDNTRFRTLFRTVSWLLFFR